MQTMITAGTDKIWAEDSGGAEPVLVLLHEGIADSRMWDAIWPELIAAFRVIRYDVRGYGQSPPATQNYTLLGDLQAVLAHFNIASAHFAGCSSGGGTAIDLALAEPDRVRSLVLLCPGVSGYPWPEEPKLSAEYQALVDAGDEDGIVQLGLREWAAAGADPFVIDLMRSAGRAVASEEQFQKETEPAFGRLSEITVPSVLMVGDKDKAALIACDEEMARRIPGCQLIWMPGVDHFPTVREPKLVLKTILRHCTARA